MQRFIDPAINLIDELVKLAGDPMIVYGVQTIEMAFKDIYRQHDGRAGGLFHGSRHCDPRDSHVLATFGVPSVLNNTQAQLKILAAIEAIGVQL
jgi:hypothetical protein